ncbi:serine/threonine-protein kinase LMTK1 isoform X1 [Strigops habroptila]|uniref:serine/threonine-protein kinase LMTK1 isoform X1 n=1 Tax=Strigops habroptila TaxID=2489341 RepID=UPI0011CFAB6B|nr:serine/threonine-protein kinase LMTK1 isoform X1 [Strigops habroptila]
MGRLAAAAAMSAAFLSPSLAFSSHFDPDGTPLSELSWSSSLAVVAVSFSGLFTFIFLMLACLCCKKGDIGFKLSLLGVCPPAHPPAQEFENAEGDDYVTELSAQGSPAPQHGPEVYVLPLTKVSLPMAKQPGRSVQLLKSADLGRQSLLYLKEIGHGWFGKVFLGEVNSGISSTQVVVKELKASASVQDQMQFLEEAQPYRALQHTNLLQCLAQCAEVTPYLLVMEFCPLGDLKGYLRSCRGAEAMTPDLLTLQRMACEVACGVLHLHRNNYIHSDLALRNCLLTADLTVKIGDYGLSHCKYKDDYFVTADQLWVPLRWIAPELIDEVHGNLLIVDQTKASNVWSLGVTIWELFELGSQPYDHYSDRQVLAYAIKEQQLKLPKPQLKLSLSERWYEVMQFCWLQPEQRPTAEEVHLLLSYLCAKGATEAEEEFEKRWNSMKPNGSASASHHGPELSSFPLLEQFSADGFPSDGDDILTVMETSHGLNFEYKWEHTKTEHFQAPLGSLSPSSAARYHDLYYPATTMGRLSLGVSPSCYECKPPGCPGLPAPGVVPILGAHSPSLGSEYYIRIEGPGDGSAELDYAMCTYSPAGERGPLRPPSCWRAQGTRSGSTYDSDSSPTVSLSMEPLLGHAPAGDGSWECAEYYPYPCPGKEPRGYEPSPSHGAEGYLLEEEPPQPGSQDWPVPGFQPGIFTDPLGVSPSVTCAYSPQGHGELQVDPPGGCVPGQSGARPDCVMVELGEDSPPSPPQAQGASPPSQRHPWASNSSSNNNIGSGSPAGHELPAGDSWCYRRMITFRGLMAKPLGTVPRGQLGGSPPGHDFRRPWQDQPPGMAGGSSSPCCSPSPRRQAWHGRDSSTSGRPQAAALAGSPATPWGPATAPAATAGAQHDAHPDESAEGSSPTRSPLPHAAPAPGLEEAAAMAGTSTPNPGPPVEPGIDGSQPAPEASEAPALVPMEAAAEGSGCAAGDADRTPDKTFSSASFPSVDEGSDEDTTELTSGVFTDFSGDYIERAEAAPAFKSLQKQVGTPDSLESLDIPSTGSSCEVCSPTAAFAPAGQTKALDSGYDTENNESPEFVLKEPHEPREPEPFSQLGKAAPGLPGGEGEGPATETRLPTSLGAELHSLAEKNPYRDSAYFSDYDAEAERGPKDEEDSDGSRTPEADESPRSPVQDLGRAPVPGEDPLHPPGAPGSPPAAPRAVVAADTPVVAGLVGDWRGAEAGSSLASPTGQAPGTEQHPAGTGLVPGSSLRPSSSVPHKTFLLTPVPVSPGEPVPIGGTRVPEGVPGPGGAKVGDEQTVPPTPGLGDLGLPPEGTGAGDAPGGPTTLRPGDESPPGLSPLKSPRELCPAAPERRDEPEEDEEDTEDSDESDEELRCYNIQEQSEESEEEPAAVPIVVAESQSGRNLRSLLKMPSLLSEAFCEDLERKKKAVSFYDDVTIYLFDQESPTRELAEQSFPEAPQPLGQPPDSSSPPSPADRLGASDDSSDGNASEESGGFEWDDDFPLMPVKPSLMASLTGPPAEPDPAVPALPALVPAQKQVLPIQFSRFTVSPAPVSRFSITHVSDSDMDSIGGSSEDGDRE